MSTSNTWTSKSKGKVLAVSEMNDNHLQNAINLCRRKNFRLKYNMLRRERYARNKITSGW